MRRWPASLSAAVAAAGRRLTCPTLCFVWPAATHPGRWQGHDCAAEARECQAANSWRLLWVAARVARSFCCVSVRPSVLGPRDVWLWGVPHGVCVCCPRGVYACAPGCMPAWYACAASGCAVQPAASKEQLMSQTLRQLQLQQVCQGHARAHTHTACLPAPPRLAGSTGATWGGPDA